ncbi:MULTISPECIES: RND family transporter [Halobacterium]|uniref:efflux RND transporter permease subunit n=1 Tax=Halobacterium TaxID=2239 RepID=UPI00073EBBC8|nr:MULTISPECIES: MMPL family transporter [Halobacterium]MCG1002129.1 MMPL family transporter [Halobacterium noricense]
MKLVERYAAAVVDHSRLVIVALLLSTVLVGSAAGGADFGLSIASFSTDSPEADAADYIQENFTTEGENTTTVQVIVRDENALSKESLLAGLRFQQAARANESINATLADGQSMVGLSNIIATAAVYAEGGRGPPPTLAEQIAQLESMSEEEVAETVARVLDPDRETRGSTDPYALLPTSYEAESTTASGRVLLVFQDTSEQTGDDLPTNVVDAQLALQDIAADGLPGESFVFGAGIVSEESGQATGESFAIISPVAFLLVVVVLGIAYRDLVDVILGLVGVGLVLTWMVGFMGWADIGLTQILIAVPFLLIGLSIDYALHVVMRYREAQADDPDIPPRVAMRRGLAGVVAAIGAATFTTAVGFLSNAVSPITSIQDFGVVSAVGIVAAFLVFGLLLPALKVEIDELRTRIGWPGRATPFGRGDRLGRVLGVGADIADRAPTAIVLVAVLLAAGGGVAATDIDTSIDQTDFLPRDSPDWMDSLPGPFQPSDYQLRANAEYLNGAFAQARGQSHAEFLVTGTVTDGGTLDRFVDARADLRNTSSAVVLADDSLQVTGPVETVRAVAQRNETVAAVVEDADTDGDGVPDRNLAGVYDAVYAAAPGEAAATIHRQGGKYRALRVTVGLSGTADTGAITTEMRTVASSMAGGSALTVTATGGPIIEEIIQRSLLTTLVDGFLITFCVILAFLTLTFWVRYRSLTLGAVVLFPVLLAQAWLFGAMYLAGLSFTTETAIIASIGIGIGVDYAIHIGERFVEERAENGEPVPALRRTVQGTGGALLASAATTIAGFSVLMLALVPSLQRFGFITSLAIGFAFLSSVLVLPSLLVVWTRVTDDSSAEAGTVN